MKRPILKLSRPLSRFRLMTPEWTAHCHQRSRELRNDRIWRYMDPVYEGRFEGWTAQEQI